MNIGACICEGVYTCAYMWKPKILSGFLLFHFRLIPLRPSLLLRLKLTFCQLGCKLASLNNYSVRIIQSWLVIQPCAQYLACLLGVRELHVCRKYSPTLSPLTVPSTIVFKLPKILSFCFKRSRKIETKYHKLL